MFKWTNTAAAVLWVGLAGFTPWAIPVAFLSGWAADRLCYDPEFDGDE